MLTLSIVVLLALVFHHTNSFHDAANETVAGGVIEPGSGGEGLAVVLTAILGVIVSNLGTWYFGLPSSSSHALIGGMAGAGVASATTVKWSAVLDKVVLPMVISPVVGLVLGYLVMTAMLWTFRACNAHRVVLA